MNNSMERDGDDIQVLDMYELPETDMLPRFLKDAKPLTTVISVLQTPAAAENAVDVAVMVNGRRNSPDVKVFSVTREVLGSLKRLGRAA